MVQVAIAEKRCETAREVVGRMRGGAGSSIPVSRPRSSGPTAVPTAPRKLSSAPAVYRRSAERRPVCWSSCTRRRSDLDRAVQIALEHLDLLEVHDVRNMIASLEAWDEPQHAAALVMALTLRTPAPSVRLGTS